MPEPRLVFVLSPFQNAFFFELADALAQAVVDAGSAAVIVTEPQDHDVADDDVFVLLPPHEYVALEGSAIVDDPRVAARTIGLSAEQPTESHFADNAAIGARVGACFDFSTTAVDAYRSAGVDARHLPFGYVPTWDRVAGGAPDLDRSLSALYLGNDDGRRLRILAGAADSLARHRAHLQISDRSEPNRVDSPSFVTGERKRDLLASARVIINIHRTASPYFEWLRAFEAAHCGALLLSEPSDHTAPFVAGEHFVEFAPDDLGGPLDDIVADDGKRATICAAAYDVVRRRPLRDSVSVLLDVATRLCTRPSPTTLPPRMRTEAVGRARTMSEPYARWRRSRRRALRRLGRSAAAVRLSPSGTRWRHDPVLPDGMLVASVVADGRDVDDEPTLEGTWPWEPWRLRHGQHLGRVLLVDPDVLDATRMWISEPWVDERPYLAVQLFAAAHGIPGGHVATPLASLSAPVDPQQSLPADLADRCRQLLP